MHTTFLSNNVVHLANAIRELNIHKFAVYFSGEGDSGQVDMVTAFTTESDPSELGITDYKEYREQFEVDLKQKVQCWQPPRRTNFNQVKGEWESEPSGVHEVPLEEFLADFAVEMSDGIDWHNNDGGFGELEFSRSTGFHFSCSQRMVTSEEVRSGSWTDTTQLLADLGAN